MSAELQVPDEAALEKLDFIDLINLALAGLQSDASRQQYGYTYLHWMAWCQEQALSPIHLNIYHVSRYLQELRRRDGQAVSFQTRLLQLIHLRKLTEGLALYHPFFKQRHEELRYLKAPVAGSNEQP